MRLLSTLAVLFLGGCSVYDPDLIAAFHASPTYICPGDNVEFTWQSRPYTAAELELTPVGGGTPTTTNLLGAFPGERTVIPIMSSTEAVFRYTINGHTIEKHAAIAVGLGAYTLITSTPTCNGAGNRWVARASDRDPASAAVRVVSLVNRTTLAGLTVTPPGSAALPFPPLAALMFSAQPLHGEWVFEWTRGPGAAPCDAPPPSQRFQTITTCP